MIKNCPTCKRQFAMPEAAIGKKVRCAGCQAVFVMEAPAEETLDVLEEITDEPAANALNTLEEIIDDAPAKAKKKGPAQKKGMPPPQPAPADDNPFAVDAAGSSLDFSSEQPRLNAGVQMRIARAANMMMLGAGMSLLLSLLLLVSAMFAQGLGGMIAAGFIYVVAIVIILCARSLRVLRSRGLGVTAAVLCLFVSLWGLGGGIMALLLLAGGAVNAVVGIIALVLGAISLGQVVNCLWGGIATLLFIFRDDVGEAIHEALEREARTAAASATLIPDACRRAAIWQVLAAILVFLHVVAYAGLLGVMLWRPAQANPNILKIGLGVAIFFFLVLLLMNAGAAVSLFMRRFFVLAFLGSGACLVSALFSYIGGVAELPFLAVALLTRELLLLSIAVATGVFMILLNVVGLVGFISGMDAARLLRKYGGGPEAEAIADS